MIPKKNRPTETELKPIAMTDVPYMIQNTNVINRKRNRKTHSRKQF